MTSGKKSNLPNSLTLHYSSIIKIAAYCYYINGDEQESSYRISYFKRFQYGPGRHAFEKFDKRELKIFNSHGNVRRNLR